MDFHHEYDYGVWQEDDSDTLCEDHDDDSSLPGTTFSYRYAMFDINQHKGITRCLNSFIDKLITEVPDEDESDRLPISELASQSFHQHMLIHEILTFVRAAVPNVIAQNRKPIQIGAVFIVTKRTVSPSATPAAEERLEKLSYEGWLLEKECVICFETFKEVEEVVIRRTPCQHVFHEHCILKWFMTSKSCPTYRFELAVD